MTVASFARISETFARLLAPMISRLPVATYENVTFTLAPAMFRKMFAATPGRSSKSRRFERPPCRGRVSRQHVQCAADLRVALDIDARLGDRVERFGERTWAIRFQLDRQIFHERVHVDLLFGPHARLVKRTPAPRVGAF